MTTSRHHELDTPGPIALRVELGRGSLTLITTDTAATTVEVHGKHPDEVEVRQDGDRVSVIGPRLRGGFFGNDERFDIRVTLPADSELSSHTGSADVTATGTLGSCEIKTGSGDVHLDTLAGPALVETGSGDVEVGTAGAELRVKCGSGDVAVRHAEGAIAVSTGSGDVEIGTARGPAAVKTGSGDFRVVEAHDDVSLATGSGDLHIDTAHRGKVTLKGASSNLKIGIPAGTPVWTDISTLSGAIHSDLEGAGEPAPGADHVELRAKTVSGDIVLTQA